MHILKERIKSIAFLLLGSNLRTSFRIKRIFKSDVLTILNLHRVQKYDGSSYSPLEPSIFSELLSYLKRNFTLTTLHSNNKISQNTFQETLPSIRRVCLIFKTFGLNRELNEFAYIW